MKIDWFLVAMALAIVLAMLFPAIGASNGPLHLSIVTQIGVALLFFLHGAKLSPADLRAGAVNWRVHVVIHGATFVLFPLLGAAVYFSAAGLLEEHLRLGFFFLCALSSTISSSVALVAMARGAVPVAVFDATLSSLLGMVLTPALLALISSAGAQPVPLLPAMRDIFISLLLPFALGQLMRPLLAGTLKRWPLLGKLDRAVIILIVYAAFCNSAQAGLWSSSDLVIVVLVAATVSAMLAIVLLAIARASRAFGLTQEDEIAATFCGATKSLVNGAPIARIMFGASPALGMIMLPLLLYHPIQLIVCSILAKRFAARA